MDVTTFIVGAVVGGAAAALWVWFKYQSPNA